MHRAIIIVLLIILFWIGTTIICRNDPDIIKFNYINDSTDIIYFELLYAKNNDVILTAVLKPNTSYQVRLVKGKKYAIKVAGMRQEVGYADKGLIDLYVSDTKLIGESLAGLTN